MNTLGITMTFLMGLTGSLHCAGMCGPIIWVMPFQQLSGFKKWLGIALYHVGRITVYAALGVLLFSFKSMFNPQLQQYVSIVLGGTLLIAGIISFFPGKLTIRLPWTGFVQRGLAGFMRHPGMTSLFFTGMLNGLLPCGLVYMALSASVVAPTALNAAVLMYAFGFGTAPMLIALTIVKDRARLMHAGHFRKFVPVVMLFFGSLFVLRGMNLGIPYLSPKVQMQQNEVKAQCCHKN
ncbi:MAG: sulfite exporter TauE/SafE family protein [Chitinophagaceae bacterium]|nr:sulfite exporter TauE/SafE family protein [Chitinophagaceae bacterium]